MIEDKIRYSFLPSFLPSKINTADIHPSTNGPLMFHKKCPGNSAGFGAYESESRKRPLALSFFMFLRSIDFIHRNFLEVPCISWSPSSAKEYLTTLRAVLQLCHLHKVYLVF